MCRLLSSRGYLLNSCETRAGRAHQLCTGCTCDINQKYSNLVAPLPFEMERGGNTNKHHVAAYSRDRRDKLLLRPDSQRKKGTYEYAAVHFLSGIDSSFCPSDDAIYMCRFLCFKNIVAARGLRQNIRLQPCVRMYITKHTRYSSSACNNNGARRCPMGRNCSYIWPGSALMRTSIQPSETRHARVYISLLHYYYFDTKYYCSRTSTNRGPNIRVQTEAQI